MSSNEIFLVFIYRGLAKNYNKLARLFALANVFRVDQITMSRTGLIRLKATKQSLIQDYLV
ncbi:hypothetical protein D104_08330 [Marinomonas profundimaris]|uniref:Uncharacterized protein n=1 Tax=Marinomonas profundimaris TaxID=1208321 RepID=W1RYQ1_9GAMM|nr:hypothetical protein D104_08330 [Marinomonas profundimaris]